MATASKRFTRRDFLRIAAAGAGAAAAGPLLQACAPQAAPATATPTAVPPTATAMPPAATATHAPVTSIMPDLVKVYPAVAASRVVQTHHSGAWTDPAAKDKSLVPEVLRKMLDASITKLTGKDDAEAAWQALFRPGEKIAIKVNAFSNSIIWTHVPLVTEVTNSLQEAGIKAEDITIFDNQTIELQMAGFAVNPDGPGVRCDGVNSSYEDVPTQVADRQVKLGNVLKNCDALINIPVLKSHMMAGVSFAMKNHYGSYTTPAILHSVSMTEIAALNAIPEIRNRTRLIIGDALAANIRFANSYPYWREDWVGDSIFMSFDPVAHDQVGLDLIVRELEKSDGNGAALIGMSNAYLDMAEALGLGTRKAENIELIEQTIG